MSIRIAPVGLIASLLVAFISARPSAQSPHVAPANAPRSGALAPAAEPGPRLVVSGVVVTGSGAPVPNASIYAYQTDAEGYYGVKPVSDNQNPRLKLFLRSGAQGDWSFETIQPGSYPASSVPAHIHFEVSAPGYQTKIFEIVFEGDKFITAAMRSNPAFSVRPIDRGRTNGPGRVTERIVLSPIGRDLPRQVLR